MGKKKNPGRMVKDLKKDVVGDPMILKQELEVLIKNLNKEKNLQQAFVLRDEDVSDFDDGGESPAEEIDIEEERYLENVADKKEKKKQKDNEKDNEKENKTKVDTESKAEEPSEDTSVKKEKKKKKKNEKSQVKESKSEDASKNKPDTEIQGSIGKYVLAPKIDEPQEEAETTKKKKKKNKKDKSKSEDFQTENKVQDTIEAPKERAPKRKKDDSKADYEFLKTTSNRSLPLIKSGSKWFEISPVAEVSEKELETKDYWLNKIETYTNKLYQCEIDNFLKVCKSNTEKQWLNTVLKSGVLTDKISAYSVLLQENPVQNLSSLDNLISHISLKSRRPCMLALDALQNLFQEYLLPGDRKLRTFKEQPLQKLAELSSGNKDTRDKYLILWMFESKLKEAYQNFLKNLQEVSKDTIDKTRTKVMSLLLILLVNSPEQEQEILSRIVNKLGDPVRSVAAKAMHQIVKLLEAHPAMTPIVMEEIEHLMYRPNVSNKAQYYGICCLTQFTLDDSRPEIANHLIKIYFSFFKASIKKGEVDTKMVSALLTGVNRAYPFARASMESLNEHKETLYKIIHVTTNFTVTLHALMLLYQVQGESDTEDRFYSAYYKKMLDSELSNMNRHAQFLNLTFKVLKNDNNSARMIAVIKRLLQVALYQQPHLMCAVLYLTSELIQARGKDAKLLEKVLENCNKPIFKEDKEENDLDDDFKVDIDTSDDENEIVRPISESTSSWVHKKVQKPIQTHKNDSKDFYDPQQRNPAFAGADHTNNWELPLMATHFHPSVANFAGSILDGSGVKYSGDPIQDFTIMRFLDRFVFRNPKKDVGDFKSSSIFNKRNQYKAKGVKSLAPDSKEYLNKELDQIPLDEQFIYKYLKEKRANQIEEEESDAESVNSEEFNEAIDNIQHEDVDFAANINDAELEKSGSEDEEEMELDGDEDDGNDLESLGEDSDSSVDGEKTLDGEELETEDFDDEENIAFSDDDDDDLEPAPTKKSKFSMKKAPKSKANDMQSLLASADDFSAMIDENMQAEMATDTAEAIFNKDKSHAKQMKWETKKLSKHKRGKK